MKGIGLYTCVVNLSQKRIQDEYLYIEHPKSNGKCDLEAVHVYFIEYLVVDDSNRRHR